MIRILDAKLARPATGFARTVGQTKSVRRIVGTVSFQTIVVCDQCTRVTHRHFRLSKFLSSVVRGCSIIARAN
jgi:hypothetical protein